MTVSVAEPWAFVAVTVNVSSSVVMMSTEGVHRNVPVPLPLSAKVEPAGALPERLSVGVGLPLACTTSTNGLPANVVTEVVGLPKPGATVSAPAGRAGAPSIATDMPTVTIVASTVQDTTRRPGERLSGCPGPVEASVRAPDAPPLDSLALKRNIGVIRVIAALRFNNLRSPYRRHACFRRHAF